MSSLVRLAAGVAVFVALIVSAQAQLLHVSFAGRASWGAPGENWFAPDELVFGETPVWIDIAYNPGLPAPPRHPDNVGRTFLPEDDPAGSDGYTFRVRFGNIDLTRPISSLGVADNGSFAMESFGNGHELDFQIFLAPPPPDLPLPTFIPENVTGNAGIVLFEHLPYDFPVDYGYLLVVIDRAIVTPVPEPSTYGAFGAALLGGAVWMSSRRRKRRATA
ncbi:PEP-CTERM sorting domain-containing protein [Opitutus terrae]|nr:PEP-CTERM sorting domain-containing protein [Opitutus terrae]